MVYVGIMLSSKDIGFNHKLYEYKNSLSGATPIDFVLSIINDNLPVSLNKEAIEEW